MSKFDKRLTFTAYPDSRPWLEPDPGSEVVLRSRDDVGRAVYAVSTRLDPVSKAQAVSAANRHGVFLPPSLRPFDTRNDALSYVCREIAGLYERSEPPIVRQNFRRLWRKRRLHDSFVFTVSLFGEGAGILLQRTSENWPYLFEERCFLIDDKSAVHSYIAWTR